MSGVFNDAADSVVIVRLCRPQLMSRASMLIITAMSCALGDAADSIVVVHLLWPQLMQDASFSHVLIQMKAKILTRQKNSVVRVQPCASIRVRESTTHNYQTNCDQSLRLATPVACHNQSLATSVA